MLTKRGFNVSGELELRKVEHGDMHIGEVPNFHECHDSVSMEGMRKDRVPSDEPEDSVYI